MTKESARRRLLTHLKHRNWSPQFVAGLIESMDEDDLEGIKTLEVRDFIFFAAKACDTSVKKVMSRSQKREAFTARSLIYEELHLRRGWMQEDVAREFGYDHATISNALEKLRIDVNSRWNFQLTVDRRNKFLDLIDRVELVGSDVLPNKKRKKSK